MIGDNRDIFAGHSFNGGYVPLFFVITEGHGDTAGFCPARATNPVYVGLGLVWHFKVDDVGNGIDVNSPRRNIAGDKDTNLTGLESV